MGVPAAHVDEADVEAVAHQSADAHGLGDEALGRDRAAAGGHHLGLPAGGLHIVGDGLVHGEAFTHRRALRRAVPHAFDQRALAVVYAGVPGLGDGEIGHALGAAQRQRQLRGEGHGLGARAELLHQTVEKTVVEIARLRALAEFDVILRFEVAAGEVARAGKGHESQLPGLPQRQQGFAQRRMQRPVGVQRDGCVGALARPGHSDMRPRLVIEAVGMGHEQIGGVIRAAQEHQHELGLPLCGGRGPQAGHRCGQRGGGGGLQKMAALHGSFS